jgi:hypothetical protein
MKRELHINIEIIDYWISWLEEDYKLYMILKIENKLHFLERSLKDS